MVMYSGSEVMFGVVALVGGEVPVEFRLSHRIVQVGGDGGSVGASAQTGDHLGGKEHALTQGGLAVAAVAQQGDVADILRSVHK